ncbi:MAG: citramalate synthase [Spirochaetes bacterium RBG_16_49_21]|nr:MAG: citramalate synthase [Spirochaetes bacterium RBG_16_49_21]
MSDKKITIYDTTLRDGAQTVGISFSLNDKLLIAGALDRLRIDYIEGGWPGSNPKDDQFFKEIRKEKLRHAKVVAFGSTRHKSLACAKDKLIQALVVSKAEIITIVAKTWDFHVTHALNIGLQDNLRLVYDTIAYLKDKGRAVFFDAEHFFDGYKANPDYSLQVIDKALSAGADMIVLCDTNGGTMPEEVRRIIEEAKQGIPAPIGVHFHNDAGMAVANSLAAVRAGAVSVQGTANGYGERCGNANLMTLVPNLVLKLGCRCGAEQSLIHLTEVSRLISETANLAHDERAPYVGVNSFAHKAGFHVSGLQKNTKTYEHVDPDRVGNRRKVLVSELSGKSNILFKARELGIDLKNRVALPAELLQKIKDLEEQGFQFEAAEGSFELLLREAAGEYKPFFTLKGFRVISEMAGSKKLLCEATIKVEVDGVIEHTAANGYGPVEALDNALRKALEKFYPEIREIQLSDYKVRVLNEKGGTGSAVRVLIDQKRKTEHWGTVGVSTDIIEASWQALVDGIEYMLFKKKEKTTKRKKS